MTIDKSGKWWVGTDPMDIHDYLLAYTEDGYSVDEFRLAQCACGGRAFRLETDDCEGVAKRICTACGKDHYIVDSETYWDEAEPEPLTCIECSSEEFNVGIGFSLYDSDDGVRWLYVGERCNKCGILGSVVDWKVAEGPARPIMEKA